MYDLAKSRSFNDWLYFPTKEESVCSNPFHSVVKRVMEGYVQTILDPTIPEEDHVFTKLAKLIKEDLILLEGDVIYVKENYNLVPLNEAISLLAYYMHTDSKEARKAADILESNFMGYFPITSNKVWRNGLTVVDGSLEIHIDLSTLTVADNPVGTPEFGRSYSQSENTFVPLMEYFDLVNQAVGEKYFFEKTIMYPFNQRIREKSHVLVGGGGNGKSIFMDLVGKLYGGKAYIDAPQPNFKGHDPAVISYGFIGKRVVTFNDVGDPSTAMLEWLKRMITGNLEVKTPSGAWLSVPCITNFFMETNHTPQILEIAAHKRRYVIREFQEDFLLAKEMPSHKLDIIGERGNITAGDIALYLLDTKDNIVDWTDFDQRPSGQQ